MFCCAIQPCQLSRCRLLSIIKNGRSAQRKQHDRRKSCQCQFIIAYTYLGCRDEGRHLIVPITMNGSGIRDIRRVLLVSINTVLKTIRHLAAGVMSL